CSQRRAARGADGLGPRSCRQFVAPRVCRLGVAASRHARKLARTARPARDGHPDARGALRTGTTLEIATAGRPRQRPPRLRRSTTVPIRVPHPGASSPRGIRRPRTRSRPRRRICRARIHRLRHRLRRRPRIAGRVVRRARTARSPSERRAPPPRWPPRPRARVPPPARSWHRLAEVPMIDTLLRRRRLRLPRHRMTTANLCSVYPFMTTTALGAHGVHLGIDLLSGGGPFAFDPFDAYRAGAITNPNMLVAGEPGVGKSATAKIFIYRSVGVFGRWAAIADPKGEYRALAEALGLSVIKLHPGGSTRLNPLDSGPFRRTASTDDLAIRNAAMIAALLGAVLRRDLSPIEDAALGWVTTTLARSTKVSAPT